MSTVTISKIYVQLLDGSTAWVPINGKQIADNVYQVLDDPEFDGWEDHPLYIFEFYPGDLIELVEHTFSDGQIGLVAGRLVKEGEWKDRRMNEFKFKATFGQLIIDKQTAIKYRKEIERIKTDISNGEVFYNGIHDSIDNFKKLEE